MDRWIAIFVHNNEIKNHYTQFFCSTTLVEREPQGAIGKQDSSIDNEFLHVSNSLIYCQAIKLSEWVILTPEYLMFLAKSIDMRLIIKDLISNPKL